ncbi:MAG TPA: hypothetical protein VLG76_08755 [Rhabdochlamydiaceae bacterium]|nr:hypothetical protein [Rhabdochlamydiaceae bacterium]
MKCNESEYILVEMDETLDQLIKNAKVIQHIPSKKLEPHELDAMQKTQESLLARLMHLDEALNKKVVPEEPLKQKAAHFHELNQKLKKRFSIRRRPKKLQKS